MDAHYSKVIKAIDEVTETGTKLYFAYSGVLDREAFEQWREEHSYHFFDLPQGRVAEGMNLDLIFDFPSRWWGGRVAGLTEKSDSSVFGLLFEIPAKHWPVIQHKEGVVTGMSIEKIIKVKIGDETLQATAFTTNPSRSNQEGPISSQYLNALIRGAKASGLPSEYVNSLPLRAK